MAVFIKIKEKFILSTSKDKDLDAADRKPIVDRFKKNKVDTLDLTLKSSSGTNVSFKCGPDNLVTGHFNVDVKGKDLEIDCNAVFKINIRPQHKDDFLNKKSQWLFGGMMAGQFGDYLIGEITKGLKKKKYKEKNRFGTVEIVDDIMTNIETGVKKTDLKI
jgi:hypothetical protein